MKLGDLDLPATITAVTGLVTAIGVILNIWLTKRHGRNAEAAGKSAEAAAKENQCELQSIHQLVNGQHMAVLKQNAASARRLAMITGAEADIRAARDAERTLEEHMIAEAKAEMEREAKAKQSGPEI